MYQVAVQRDFIAQHYLVGGDWGAESKLHSHHYRLELVLEGESLDEHGYLTDIVEIERALEAEVATYRDTTLNDAPAFQGLNPSLEHFCRILCQSLSAQLPAPNILRIMARLWENEIAWAAYQMER
jgi:6-pyruvoyltetrahydropterin/6-carboxytetrahydropterin synthase